MICINKIYISKIDFKKPPIQVTDVRANTEARTGSNMHKFNSTLHRSRDILKTFFKSGEENRITPNYEIG